MDTGVDPTKVFEGDSRARFEVQMPLSTSYRSFLTPSPRGQSSKRITTSGQTAEHLQFEESVSARVRANTRNAYLRAPVDSDFVIVSRCMVSLI